MNEKQAVSVELKDLVKVFPAYGSQDDFVAVNLKSRAKRHYHALVIFGAAQAVYAGDGSHNNNISSFRKGCGG